MCRSLFYVSTCCCDAVPPSAKPATTSLKIDKFLRPFTFKAVKELLAQTGTVEDVWMDQIKTHCYVTVSLLLWQGLWIDALLAASVLPWSIISSRECGVP